MVGRRGPRARTVVAWAGGVTAAVLLVTGAAVAQGYDAEDLPVVETSVWVARAAAGGQYAMVNTDVAEIVSVNTAQGLAGVAQAGSAAVVFGSGHTRYWPLDPAVPVDISAEEAAAAGAGVESPAGTTGRVAVGPYLLFTGPAPAWGLASTLDGDAPSIHPLDPAAGLGAPESDPAYVAAVSSMSRNGLVALYSTQSAERRVVVHDTRTGSWDWAAIASPPESAAGLQLSFVGDRWVLFVAAGGGGSRLWVEGAAAPFALPGVGGEGLLQSPGAAADSVAIAHAGGLALVHLSDGAVETVAASGTPARPAAVGDGLAAAWLTTGGGTLWSSAGGLVPLVIDGGEFEQNVDVTPTIASNGDRAVLVESTTGMLWSVPDGVLIPLAAWTAGEPPPQEGQVEVPDAAVPEPPVAEPDAFGVRAGALAVLPVVYNDHDPNSTDVLSIDPTSIEGLDPAFGTVALVGSNQSLVIDVVGAVESASFSYRVTDGTSSSPPTTVTLTRSTGDAAPVWCDEWVEPECFVQWPSPQLAVGGTVRVDVLKGWVDPDGDPMVLASAIPEPGAPLVAMPGADGSLAIAHLEDRGGAGQYAIDVRVMDARGLVSEPRELLVTVEALPGFAVTNGLVLGRVGEWARADIGDFAAGGSGTFRIADAVDVSATLGGLDLDWNPGSGTLDLRAAEVGSHLVSVLVVDAATQQQRTLMLRVEVTDPALEAAAMPPLTAFVRPGEDTVVDVLSAASNTTGQVLLLTNAVSDTGALAAAIIDETSLQIRATAAGRGEGPIGTIRLTATTADGRTVAGSLTVFLVAAATSTQPIALADAATVRAGGLIDIDVLDNDVAPRGERLALHPDVSGSGTPGELAFASGSQLRYRAPDVPGVYTVFYYAYLPGSPTLLSRAQVTVQVLAAGANRAPQAQDIEARVLAGRSIDIPVDLASIDPDGDRVVLAAVTQPSRPQLGAVMIGADGRSLRFTAPEANQEQPTPGWQADFEYTVRDAGGETDTATVRVGVSVQDFAEVTPVVFTDHVQVQAGTTGRITVEPLRNDTDPAQASLVTSGEQASGLRIIDLRPSMAGLATDPTSPYSAAASLMVAPTGPTTATPGRSPDPYPDGVVAFELTADTLPGTYTYLYTVESRQTTSTAQALIVLTVTEASAPDRPTIRDTVVTAADRARVRGGGIDVLTGRVSWATGDVAALTSTLELAPGAPAGFSVRPGTSRIQGPLPEAGAIVPFQVSGTDRTGEAFTTYGFLRIPAFDDLRLAVQAKPAPIREETSGEIDLEDILAIGDTDTVEVRADGPFTVHRPDSACEPVGGSVIRYHAGYFPMFTDSCTLQARLTGQSDDAWSTIVVPIDVEPKDPLAILTPMTLTLSITQAPTRIDLYDSLVTWYGNRALDPLSDLSFTWAYAGSQFEVTPPSGAGTGPDQAVTVQARGTASTGTRETIRVGLTYTTVDGFAFDETVNIVLYVGLAPPEHPSGASLALSCNARNDPTGCEIPVILPADVSGQFNPVRAAAGDTSLRLVGVGGGTAQTAVCTGVAEVAVRGGALRFTWLPGDDPAKPFGGQCVMPFTVQDVQGRTGQGQVTFAADGFPQRPGTPVTAAYGADWVDIDVPIGAATTAVPPVTSVRLLDGTTAVAGQTCERLDVGAFRCRVTGLANGVEHTWRAVTTNAVGDSAPTAMAYPTNAYRAPAFTAGPSYATQQFDARTTPTTGILLVRQACADSDAERIRFVVTDSVTRRTFTKSVDATGCVPGGTDLDGLTPAPGGVQLTATPISRFTPPIIGNVPGSGEGGADHQSVLVRGAPTVTSVTATPNAGSTAVALSVAFDRHAGDGTRKVAFLAWAPGQPGTTPPTCVASADGATSDSGTPFVDNSFAVTAGSGTARVIETTGTTATFQVDGSASGLEPNRQYVFAACVTVGYGWAQQRTAPVWLVQDPGAPTSATMTYTPAARADTMNASYLTDPGPGVDGPAFVWTVPDTDPVNDAAADLAAQLAAIQAATPAPSGSAWGLRYATVASNNPADYTRAAIDDNTSTFFAKFCFAADGQDFCSSRSAPIVSSTPSVGIAFGGTGSVTLPTAAMCTAAVDARNAQIAQAGEQAVLARLASLAAADASTARNAATAPLQSHLDTTLATYTGPPGPPNPNLGGDPALETAFFDGYPSGQPGYNAGGPAAGRTSAQARIDAVGQAAYDGVYVQGTTPGTPEYANYYAAADDGAVREGAEATAFATPPTAPAITSSGFVGSPAAPFSGVVVTALDDGSRRYTGLHYQLGGITGTPAFASDYLVEAITTDYASYGCG